MKRSEINAIMRRADEFIRQQNFRLPPFAYWTPEEWKHKGPEVREIVQNKLGWDITDFGKGDFPHSRSLPFHHPQWKSRELENDARQAVRRERSCWLEEGQVTPFHFHWSKMEDIINRGGGKLLIKLYNSTPDEDLDDQSEVVVSIDSTQHKLPAGSIVTAKPRRKHILAAILLSPVLGG